jgi:hypothetical protein
MVFTQTRKAGKIILLTFGVVNLAMMAWEPYAAESSVLANAGSAALIESLRTVTEASDGRGRSRYPQHVNKALVQTILGRRYGPALLELCYLLLAANQVEPRQGYVGFFWQTSLAHKVDFQLRWAATTLRPDIDVAAQEIILKTGSSAFSISYARMPFLAALLDFLITVLGFAPVNAVIMDFVQSPTKTKTQCGQTANKLARMLYAYLQEHVASAHQNRKLWHFLRFLKARHSGDFQMSDISDSAILDFWLQPPAGTEEPSDYRSFKHVMTGFMDLRRAMLLGQGRLALLNCAPMIDDWSKDQIIPAVLTEDPQAPEFADETILEALVHGPANRLKFINKRECDDLKLLFSRSISEVESVPLTLLRGAVFGHLQSCLSQALRRGAGPATQRCILRTGPVHDYRSYVCRMTHLAEHLERSTLAALDILIRAQHIAAIEPILAHAESSDWLLKNLSVAAMPIGLVQPLFARLHDGRVDCGVAQLLHQARLARSAISRDGFRLCQGTESAVIDAAAEGMGLAKTAASRIRYHLKTIRQNFSGTALDLVFEQDRQCFSHRLGDLYGLRP